MHRAVAEYRQLLQRRQCVAHAAAGVLRHDFERLGIVVEVLLFADVGEPAHNVLVADTVKIEPLAARKDGFGNLLRIGRAEHEQHMLGRLFERLEQGVERLRGEHVDLVDDIDLVCAAHRGEAHRVDDFLADVIHAGAACSVELVDIRMRALGDALAFLARAIRHATRGALGASSGGALAE
ncbi:dual specificity phosphatase catalytic domain protein [Collinsella sp. CAG:398]|nr:dual specificity phosphatase catalytic domain protein [Collinsella sp. CAG:398]